MNYFIRLAFEKALEGLVGAFLKSPTERDFGEAREDDIVVPDAEFWATGQLEYLEEHLVNAFAAVDGLTQERFAKLHTRLWELPKDKIVEFPYQVREPNEGRSVELQIRVSKTSHNLVAIRFKSTAVIIQVLKPLLPKQVEKVATFEG